MKKILLAVALLALVGCDSKYDAPFNLKWGQTMDSVSFIKNGECEKKENITTCTFNNQKPFNAWSYSNELKFDNDKLIEVATIFAGTDGQNPSFDDFKRKLGYEANFLLDNGFDKEILSNIKQKCEDSSSCDKTSVRAKTAIGNTSIWVTTTTTRSPIAVVTFTP
ncbi:hypothetical protein MASR2M36_38640 [Providencia sp.]